MEKFPIDVREHSCVFIERKGQRVASRYQLFTAADLSLPSHCVPLFIQCVCASILNIRMRKCFDGEIFSLWSNIRVFVLNIHMRKCFDGENFHI